MEQFVTFGLFLTSFLIGYHLGRGRTIDDIQKTATDTIKKIERIYNPKIEERVGSIKRPTARDIYLKEHPEIKEGMQEMAEDLKKQGI